MDREIKNCPFCGGKAATGYSQSDTPSSGITFHYWCGCEKCGFHFSDEESPADDRAWAITAWNTRQPSPLTASAEMDEYVVKISDAIFAKLKDKLDRTSAGEWRLANGDMVSHRDYYDECPTCQAKEEDMQILREQLKEAESQINGGSQ